MLTTNYSNFRNHLKDYCDKACDLQETVLITEITIKILLW